MKFGLEQHTIDNIVSVFEQHSKVDKAIVFGSRAKGNYRTDSDIDIAIKGQDLNTDDIIAMSVAFEEKGIAHKIDLINYQTINEPDLKDHIDRVGIELYSRWKEYRFSDFVLINPTVSLKSSEEYSFVEMRDLEDGNKVCTPSVKRKPSSGARFREKDTLFARITPCLENGKICQVRNLDNGIGFGSTEFLVFRGKENVSDNDFIFYLSRWNKVRDFAENNFEGTSGRQRVPKDCFNKLKLELPPLTEQTAIASILSTLDDKIDLLQQQNKTLEQMAETLFRQWFVEEAEESWEEKSFADLIETTLGGEWGKENPEGEYQIQVQCVRGTDIADLETGIPTRTPIRFIKQKKFASIEIKDGDLIMEISGGTDDQSTGRTAYINEDVKRLFEFPLTFSNFCRLIRPKKKAYSFFLFSYIHHLYKQGDLFNLENGSSGIKNLNYKALLFNLEYKMPSEKSILEFNNNVELYYFKINKNKHQILTLTKTRDTLLPKLMSGEVRIKL